MSPGLLLPANAGALLDLSLRMCLSKLDNQVQDDLSEYDLIPVLR